MFRLSCCPMDGSIWLTISTQFGLLHCSSSELIGILPITKIFAFFLEMKRHGLAWPTPYMDITGLTVYLWTLISLPYSKMKIPWNLNQANSATELKKEKTSDGEERSVAINWPPSANNEYLVLIYLLFYFRNFNSQNKTARLVLSIFLLKSYYN